MKVIGLTGPSGAGKTAVAGFLNLPVVDADKITRLVHKDPVVLARLQECFGNDILSTEGMLNRSLLASRAFATRQTVDALNAIMHPKILERIHAALAGLDSQGESACLLDAPLLFEANCEALCNTTVAVLASREVRKHRIMARDGISADMAELRLSAQPNDQYYIDRCEHVIYNNGNLCDLQREVQGLLTKI